MSEAAPASDEPLNWQDDVNAPVEAEIGLLGAALVDETGEAAKTLFGVDLDDFAVPHARNVADAMRCAMNGHPSPDAREVASILRERGEGKALAFLMDRLVPWPTGANAAVYAERVRFFSRRRAEHRLRLKLARAGGRDEQDRAKADLDAFLATTDDERAWPEILPLEAYDRPAFPVDALPRPLAEWAAAVAVSLQVPTDVPAMLCLPVLAAACARKWEVQIREGWIEPLNLYCLTAMPPGTRKSAAFAAATRIFYEYEKSKVEEERPERLREVANYEMLEKRVAATNAARAAAKDAGERMRAETAFQSAMKEFEDTPKPAAELRLVGDDVTPERVVGIMSEQGDRFAIFSAEGGMLNTLAGTRYSKTSMPSYDALLKSHAGDPISHDRKGSDLVRVQHPALTLGLCVQPEILRNLANAPGAYGVGLIARFLYSVPVVEIGSRAIRAPSVAREITLAYRGTVGTLVESPSPSIPATLRLEPLADDLLAFFEEEIEFRIGPEGDLCGLVEWASKLAGATARVAALLALADAGTSPIEYISEPYVAQAIRIARYLIVHARAALSNAGKLPEIEAAERILAWIKRKGLREFTTRQAYQQLKRAGGAIQRISDVAPAINVLVETGNIRAMRFSSSPIGGRARSPMFETSPTTRSKA